MGNQGNTESGPLPSIVRGNIPGPANHAAAHGGHIDSRTINVRQRRLERLTGRLDHLGLGCPVLLQAETTGADCALRRDAERGFPVKAIAPAIHQEGRDSSSPAARIRLCINDDQIGGGGVDYPGLLAVQDPLVAVPLGVRFDGGEVRPGLRLGQRCTADPIGR